MRAAIAATLRQRASLGVFLGVCLGTLWACAPASAETLRFVARLSGASTAAASASRGGGTAELVLDTDSKVLSWRITYAGLTGPLTGAHFTTPPEPGSAPDPTLDLVPPLTSPIVSSTRLNDIEIGDLRAGLWSISLLTARNPQGEIGGDLEQAP